MKIKKKKSKIPTLISQAENAYIDKDWHTFDALLAKWPRLILNHRSSDNNSFLHYAVWTKNYQLMKKLIEAGADINAQNGQGHTPLINACAKGDGASAGLLIDAGADIKIRDAVGRDAMYFSKAHSNSVLNNLIVGKQVRDSVRSWPKKKKPMRIKRR